MSEVESKLIADLLALGGENEWIEFKSDYCEAEEIGEYLSALSNSAALHKKEKAYLVFGVDNASHQIVGTSFNHRQAKVGNEELENWLSRSLSSSLDFRITALNHNGKPLIVFEIPPALHTPVRFQDHEYIRIGSYKKKLKDYPEKERVLWSLLSKKSFEKGISLSNIEPEQVLSLIDYPNFFDLLNQHLPDNRQGILERLEKEKIIIVRHGGLYDVTNLGAILFAKDLDKFEHLARKAVRVIIYKGTSRVETVKELMGNRGYAVGFNGLISYMIDQLPQNEEIGRALRREVKMYPEIAIRELVANALIHQDFMQTGTGPTIEIFQERIEITNPGTPLIDTLRFIDEPPQSRNESLASLMRRLNICEERGSGIDKVVFNAELFQLPAPDFVVTENHTKSILYSYRKLSEMDKKDRIRACYQHACLCWVSHAQMTNTSLRKRFAIDEKNYAMASRIISDSIKAGLIKSAEPENKSRKHAKYVPFWL